MSADPGAAIGHHVQVRGAVKRYGGTAALGGVDFEVEPGQFLVLLGPSGSGKSTLVRSLAGIERLDEGQVLLSGQLASDGLRHLPPERRDLAMVFQDYALWPHLTVLGNVGYALRRRRLSRTAANERVAAALDRVGLGAHAARYPHELSGGEQQRVALARALAIKPALLFADEPTGNLDSATAAGVVEMMFALLRDSGSALVLVTHDLSLAARADRTLTMVDGRATSA